MEYRNAYEPLRHVALWEVPRGLPDPRTYAPPVPAGAPEAQELVQRVSEPTLTGVRDMAQGQQPARWTEAWTLALI